MTEILTALQAAAPSVTAEGWETAKGVMLTLSTAATMWIARTLFTLRDAVRDLKKTVIGADGQNGLNSKIKNVEERVDSIENRNREIDAVARAEKEQYDGPERRQNPRRLRDTLIPEMPSVDEGGA